MTFFTPPASCHTSGFPPFSDAFRDSLREDVFAAVQAAGHHTDEFLVLAAGREALARLHYLEAPPVQILQQAAGMNAQFGAASNDPGPDLHNLVPWDALRRLDTHLRDWNAGTVPLCSETLRGIARNLEASVEGQRSFFKHLPRITMNAVLDVASSAGMARRLAECAEYGIADKSFFRKLWDNLPHLENTDQWRWFRGSTLEQLRAA
jgi:hypothetical protein